MPPEVQDLFGYALHLAQVGRKHDQAKPLKGQGAAAILEVVEDWQGDTLRAVYTVRDLRLPFMCCNVFRRRQPRESPRPGRSWILFLAD